jgi:Tfp pilus assembly protein PilN
MRAVNLLPRQVSNPKVVIDRMLVLGIALTLLVTTLVAGGFFLEKSHAASEAKRAAAIEAAVEHLRNQQSSSPTPAARLEIPVVLSQAQPWHVALDSVLSSRVAWDTFLQELEYVVPDNVSISNVTVGGAGAASGVTDGSITLAGSAFSSEDVAVFLSTLARVPGVSDTTLVNETRNAGSKDLSFQITAQMALPAALTAPPVTEMTTTPTGG